MSELVFHKIQLGTESEEGTAVAATAVYPCDPGAVTEIDRSPQDPVEDYGHISEQHAGRGAYGVRLAKLTLPSLVRFEDIIRLFDMGVAGGVTPTAAGGGYWNWKYTADDSADSLKSRTVEEGTTDQQAWQIKGALIDTFTLEFGPITAPGEFPWKISAELIGRDKQPISFTAGLSAPSNLETMQGHYSTVAIGSNAVAFGSLPALTASLIQYRLTVNNNIKMRIYGGTTDTATSHGRLHRQIGVEAQVKMSATTKNVVYDIFNAAQTAAIEQRMRVSCAGTGSNAMTIDHRLRYSAIPLAERDGEQVYSISGKAVRDDTLSSDLEIAVTNLIAS